jgi:hypothetical protein
MKRFLIFIIAFLFTGLCSIIAQDLVVLRDGNMIEAKVIEISSLEIRYKRFDNLEGPTIVIPKTEVLSIRYENGTTEVFNSPPTNQQAVRTQTTAIDPDRFIFGINANAGGAIGYAYSGGSGAGVNIELGKGNFNSEINLMIPAGGFGLLLTFNYFAPSSIGGFYIGGGAGYIYTANTHSWFHPYGSHINTLGLNLGYKYVMSSGLYFRTGAFIGVGIDWATYHMPPSGQYDISFFLKPDLAVGWTIR